MSVARRPAFLSGGEGSLFLIELGPAADAARATVVACAPFAEEMNRSRRMLVLMGEALAGHGVRLVLFDYYGTGDSAGDFGAATVERWCTDAAQVADYAAASRQPLIWLGVRFGALLAARMARELPGARGLLLWQPTTAGRTLVAQFLRLHAAAQITGALASAAEDPRQRLAQGLAAEVAGYELSPALIAQLAALDLIETLRETSCPVHWMEVIAQGASGLPPASQRAVDGLATAARCVPTDAIAGDPFWSTPEQTLVPALIERTLGVVDQWLSHG
jgi:exosortase A-associated hydrolase 2